MALNDQELQYYKEEYNGHKIIYVRFSNTEFLFRTISVKEYELILRTYNDTFQQENAICNISCIYPDTYDFETCEYGVLPSVISGYIKKLSSVDEIDDIFSEYDNAKQNYNLYQQCMDLIKAFIKDYTYEEMEEWTWEKLMQMTVRAENIAKFQGYDYHIERYEESNKQRSIHNNKDCDELINNKTNPLIYFKDEIQKEINVNNNIVETPFIIGLNWNNKEILNGFRNQKFKQRN